VLNMGRLSQTLLPFVLSSMTVAAPSTTVGKHPPLGWNSWNAYACNIDEAKVISAANTFISKGLKAAGYQYVNVDDCWSVQGQRDAQGRIIPDPTKFPDGINGTASQIHDLGLLFGIYSDAGTETCAGFPASLGNEEIDATTFSDWGVDYLKYDNCNIPANWTDASSYTDWSQSNSAKRYKQMSAAIATLSKPIQLNLCIWGTAMVWEWGATVGESWRMTGDITATWSSISSIISQNVPHLSSVDFFAHNDMDMMEIGNGNLTTQEQRSHFAMWAALKSPILLGTNLDNLSDEQFSIITNAELLAFSQDDSTGKPALPFGTATTSPPEFYAGASVKGMHVFVLNTGSAAANKTITFSDVPGLGSGSFLVHDMWAGSDVGTFENSFTALVDTHDTGAWLVTPA